MRTAPAVMFVFAFATGVLIWQLAGVGALFGVPDPGADLQSGEKFEDQTNDSVLEDGDQDSDRFNPDTRGEDNVVGFIISGFTLVFDYVRLVVLFPIELQNLGVPRFAAYPVGILLQAVTIIGVGQFASGRNWT